MSSRTAFVSCVVLMVVGLGAAVRAETPNQAFNGRIMLSAKRFPQSASSASAYTAQIRKQSIATFAENKESHSFKIFFAGFLKAPLNDLEYAIKIYDVSGKGSQLLVTFEQYTSARGQQSIISDMTLEKKAVGVNKELLMTMESKGKVLASSKFKITGEGEHFTGKVDFSEDEANGGKTSDDN
ncbi:MAG TPA: hypothetical protein VFP84_12055 [Kofleriaceae bacterium]|nr:hypothetical protein [Kofleriaceae bacterium]